MYILFFSEDRRIFSDAVVFNNDQIGQILIFENLVDLEILF